ncbi:MAG: prepilin-type N-terminal cleavage/methylation domain-containing protein [Candidatus Margulisbacteria bacterium]|nr:prepilin-type N-terminal cleavage/methylation domain-containing protein [Candidatus Margulisiibacteriota bacterium]
MKHQGFSLIELIMVLTVIAILSVVSFIALDPYKGIKLDAATRKIAADVEYARSLALTTAKWHGIGFDVAPANKYSVYKTDGSTDEPIENPAKLGTDFIVLTWNDLGRVKINSAAIGGGQKIEFSPLGAPYNDKNGSALATPGIITLEYSGITRRIEITPNTGKISIL